MMPAMTAPALQRPASHAELDDLTLARARRGEDAACRALVVRYQKVVFAVLHRVLAGSRAQGQVEDLAQETFLRVFKALPGFRADGPARLSTWILTIASNLAVDVLRKRQLSVVGMEDASHVPSPLRADHAADARRVGRAVETALARLPEEQRVLFVLRAYHDVSHEELCAAFDLELGTVKSRLSRARAALQQSLSAMEVTP